MGISTTAAAAAAASITTTTNEAAAESSSSIMTRKEKTQSTTTAKHHKNHTSADVTRRMVCGGLSGMIAKVCSVWKWFGCVARGGLLPFSKTIYIDLIVCVPLFCCCYRRQPIHWSESKCCLKQVNTIVVVVVVTVMGRRRRNHVLIVRRAWWPCIATLFAMKAFWDCGPETVSIYCASFPPRPLSLVPMTFTRPFSLMHSCPTPAMVVITTTATTPCRVRFPS
jgi:hypothetical protein